MPNITIKIITLQQAIDSLSKLRDYYRKGGQLAEMNAINSAIEILLAEIRHLKNLDIKSVQVKEN